MGASAHIKVCPLGTRNELDGEEDGSTGIGNALLCTSMSGGGFSLTSLPLQLAFERCVQLLRAGATPVGVLEGIPPPEKMRLLHRRWGVSWLSW